MRRTGLIESIKQKLLYLYSVAKVSSKVNNQDDNVHAENFFRDFFNLLFAFELQNINKQSPNHPGIDLVDSKNRIICQISSTSTKYKIEDSLLKDSIKEFNNYRFIFIPIVDDASALKKNTYKNPYGIIFEPEKDIYDGVRILKEIIDLKTNRLQEIYDFMDYELSSQPDVIKFDTNIANIINILALENLSLAEKEINLDSFAIDDKIEYNNLGAIEGIINEYKVYYGKLQEKYAEFDRAGVNKSYSVYEHLYSLYIGLKSKELNTTDLFLKLFEKVRDEIINSKNYHILPMEELNLCVYIVLVDAFVRCKIFEKPEEKKDVNSQTR